MRTTREDENVLWRVKVWSIRPDGTEGHGTWHGPFFRKADASRAVSMERKNLNRQIDSDRHNARWQNLPTPPVRELKVQWQRGTVEWVDV